MLLEAISLDSITAEALRLVTFASQSLAQAFVRSALGKTPDENGLLVAARMDGTAVQSFRQAVCKVANMPRTIAHNEGDTYEVSRGDRKGMTVTAAFRTYRPYTTAEYHEACKVLCLALVEDETTVVTKTEDDGKVTRIASYAIRTTKPVPAAV